MLVRVPSPKTKVEELKLEYDVLITQRMQEKCLQNLIVKHEAQFEMLHAKLNLKELDLKKLKQKK
jgi:hypothetical protein